MWCQGLRVGGWVELNRKRSASPAIEGIVVPSKRDEEGHPLRIALRSDGGTEYRIDFGGAGKELLTLVHQRVKVCGRLRQQLDGGETLIVRSYRLVAPESGRTGQ